MKKVITYGTYDFLHYGHIALLKRAKKLGDYLIVGVTSDGYDKSRGKMNVQQSVVERIEAIKATGLADKIIVEEYEGQKIADIKKYDIDVFAIGSDWEGKFDYLLKYCEVVYLIRTEGISSTEIRQRKQKTVKLGLIGCDNPTGRIISECEFVNGLEVIGVYDASETKRELLSTQYNVEVFDDIDKLLSCTDAVYINDSVINHVSLIEKSLCNDCHVLCENPLCVSSHDIEYLFSLARKHKKVVMEAVKTLFFPAFEHLLLIVNSGAIGEIKDVSVSCSQIPNHINELKKHPERGCMYDWGGTALSAIIKLLGTNYKNFDLYSFGKDGFDYFIRGILEYEEAIATFKLGLGIKTEGDMVITGTKGYIYIYLLLGGKQIILK